MSIPLPANTALGSAPARVASCYAAVALLWIWLSDRTLVWLGYVGDDAFLAAAVKGTAFVLVTAVLLFWLVRREVAAARRSDGLLRAVVEGTTDAVYVKDRDGRHLLVNAAAARFVGRPVSEVLGRDAHELFAAADAERLNAADRAVMAGGKPVTSEETLTSAGVSRTYHATKAPLRDAGGRVVGLVGISRDISDRKRVEAALRESEQRFRDLGDAIPQIVWTAGPDGPITHVNAKGTEYTGLRADELAGSAWERVIHPDDAAHAKAEWSRTLGDGVPRPVEMRIRRADGAYRWHICRQRPVRDAGGRIASWVGTNTDVDDLKQTEAALRETDARLREAQRIARLGSWSWEPPADRVWWSDAEFELFGLDPAAVTPSLAAFLAIVHPDDLATAVGRVEAMKAGADAFADDLRVVRPDGVVLCVHSRGRATRDGSGRLVRVEGTDQDVTAERQAAAAVRESEARYRLLFKANPHPMWVYDRETLAFLAVNNAAVAKYGYARDEFLGMTIADIRPPEDVPALVAKVAAVTDGFDDAGVWRHRLKDGRLIRVRVTSHTLTFAGRPAEVVLAQDVTAQLAAEEEIRAGEERLRLALVAGQLGTFDWDMVTNALVWSDTHYDLWGYPPDEPFALEYRHFADRLHPDDRAGVERAFREAVAAGSPYAHEYRVVRPDGTERWVAGRGEFTLAADGTPVRMLGTVQDVTTRKQAQAALRASEERFRAFMDHSPAAAWITDTDGRFHYVSSNYFRLFTVPRPDLIGRSVYDVYAAEFADQYVANMRRVAASDMPLEAVERAPRPDGSVGEFLVYKFPLPGGGGLVGGVAVDVTDRARAEAAVRDSEERYRRLVAVLPAAVLVHDGDRILLCNPAFVRLVGAASADAVVGRRLLDCVHPDDRPLARSRLAEVVASGVPAARVEKRFLRDDGRPVRVFSVTTPITGYGGPTYLAALSDLSERERAMDLLRAVLGSVGDAILTIDERGTVTSANPATERLFGYAERELVGGNVSALMPEPFRGEHDGYLAAYLRTGVAKVIGIGREVEGRRKDGTTFPAELTVTEFALDGERHFTGVLRDISARKKLEEQFRQSQKMEAVGRLAGGVAHDFNNLLTVINGYCELLLASDLPARGGRESVAAIRDAGERAARLTQQLLAFSRKTVLAPKVLDLSELVAESARLLRRLIGEDVVLAVVTAPTPVRVKADPGQLEQVIMNLVVNARDAMPTGGRLTLEAAVVAGEAGDATRFARLSVTDTGHGMSAEVKEKIFEPFFTTKGVGKGTGLGLAVVHGVVAQSGGRIDVASAVGVGTTFRLLFPLVPAETGVTAAAAAPVVRRGSETVLLVEDEDAVRTIARLSLEMQGYAVLEADGGAAAVKRAVEHPGEIHLVVSDVVMPEMGGRQLLEAVRRHRPGVRVLFMSGYTDDAVLRHGVEEATDAFIQKPFTPLSLARKVREVLDAPPG